MRLRGPLAQAPPPQLRPLLQGLFQIRITPQRYKPLTSPELRPDSPISRPPQLCPGYPQPHRSRTLQFLKSRRTGPLAATPLGPHTPPSFLLRQTLGQTVSPPMSP